MMRALRVLQPHAQAIAKGTKTIEYRSAPVQRRFLGQQLAVHCGHKFDHAVWGTPLLRSYQLDVLTDFALPGGRIIAVAVIDRCEPDDPPTDLPGGVRAGWRWHLRDAIALPMPLPGIRAQQYWFKLTEDQEREIRLQIS